MAEIDAPDRHLDPLQRPRHEPDYFEVGGDAGVAVHFGADQQRLAARGDARRQGMQHAAAIAQPGDARLVEQVRVDARRLRGDVGADAERPAGKLVGELESAQLEILPGAGQQRFEVFEQRRHDELEAAAAEVVEQRPAQAFDALGLGRQRVGDMFG